MKMNNKTLEFWELFLSVLSFVFPSKNLKIKIYTIIILPAALYMHGTWSLSILKSTTSIEDVW
jgi:hypothetical protein